MAGIVLNLNSLRASFNVPAGFVLFGYVSLYKGMHSHNYEINGNTFVPVAFPIDVRAEDSAEACEAKDSILLDAVYGPAADLDLTHDWDSQVDSNWGELVQLLPEGVLYYVDGQWTDDGAAFAAENAGQQLPEQNGTEVVVAEDDQLEIEDCGNKDCHIKPPLDGCARCPMHINNW